MFSPHLARDFKSASRRCGSRRRRAAGGRFLITPTNHAGSGSNLLTRAAMVTLKERRPLIVCHRETPLSLIDIENMQSLTLAGAIVCPTNPGLYLLPRGVEDLVDFIAGKVLDLLGVPHEFKTRRSPDAGAARSRCH